MSNFHSFNTEVAKETGVVEAVFLQHFSFWHCYNRDNNKHFHDGSFWTYNTLKAFRKQFPYLSKGQIETVLNKLKRNGYIITANYNTSAQDRTLWYALTVQACQLLDIETSTDNAPETPENSFPENRKSNSENQEMQFPKSGNDRIPENRKCNSRNQEMIYKDTVKDITVNNQLETTVNVCADAHDTDTPDLSDFKKNGVVADASPGTPPPTPAPAYPPVKTVNGKMKLPALADVTAYMASRGAGADQAERMFDFYTSKGWKVGRNPMKDWQAACRNWLRDNLTQNTPTNATSANYRPNTASTVKKPFVFNYDDAINELNGVGPVVTSESNDGTNFITLE